MSELDLATHWEHKYANARQYSRNLEDRRGRLERALREIATMRCSDPEEMRRVALRELEQ